MAKPTLPQFAPLSDEEHRWIKVHAAGALGLVGALTGSWDKVADLGHLDAAWSAWLATDERDTTIVNETINAFGAAFGETLVMELGFEWTIATDTQGTDLAVRALPGTADVLVYPANFVAKRWEKRVAPFFVDAFAQISEELRRFEAMYRKRP